MTTSKRNLRIMWNSNGVHTNSGYGVFTKDLLYRLLKDGWPVASIAFYGLQGSPITLDGLKMYPVMSHIYGSDAMVAHSQDFNADVVFSMQDVPTLDVNMLKKIKKWIPYVPIDQEPVPPMVLNALKYAYKIIAFSEYGKKALEKHGFYSQLIVEGTDVNIFKPLDKKNEIRKELNLPQNAFLFGMVSANKENPPRKGYQEVLEAFKLFLENHPEGVLLLHTQQIAPKGFPIRDYSKHLGISHRVFFVNQYKATYKSGSEEIAKEMNALDVYLQPSQTEGFGLTSIEAQACGKPVIVNNCMSMPELIVPGKTGEICDTGYRRYSSQRGFWYTADVKSLHEKMEKVYRAVNTNRNRIAKDCRNHIVKNYNMDTLVEKEWIPMLENLQKELTTKKNSDSLK